MKILNIFDSLMKKQECIDVLIFFWMEESP